MKVWWLGSPSGHGNFGDVITPKIFDHFKIPYEYSDTDYEAICIGSIAKRAQAKTLVLGSGIISKNDPIDPKAIWKFARGPFTRNRVLTLGGKCPRIYGDPALLLPLFCEESEKKYDVGIVPHIVDLEYVKETYPNAYIIDLNTKDVLQTARQITQCRRIISSSLHGIITAHAYGIPAAWVKFGHLIKGDNTKFEDHYASLGINAELSTMKSPVFTTGVWKDQNKVIKIFESLGKGTSK